MVLGRVASCLLGAKPGERPPKPTTMCVSLWLPHFCADVSTPTNHAVYGYQQLSTVRHGHQQTLSVNPSKISASTGIGYLQHAVGVVAEQTLVSRLAAVWKMPTECLLAQVQAVSSLLRPSGLGTTAHALWVSLRQQIHPLISMAFSWSYPGSSNTAMAG